MDRRWIFAVLIALLLCLCCFLVAAGMAGYLYTRAANDASRQSDSQPTLEPTPRPNIIEREPLPGERDTARRVSEVQLPQRELAQLANRLRGVPIGQGDSIGQAPPALELGRTQVFWVNNEETTSFFTATASLAYATAHAYWWVEPGFDVLPEDLERSALNFEQKTYPTNRSLFGSEPNPGIDGDVHIYIFLGDVPGVAGYFSSPDEYPVAVSAYSNQHEIFYINLNNAMPGNGYFDGVLAHEFQHMIHWAVDRNEDTWVNEGLSELAVLVNRYDLGDFDVAFSSLPDTQLTAWPELEDSAAHYGASYLFMAYFLERYGEEAVRRLVAEKANGAAGFDAVLAEVDPTKPTFSDLFADWVVANYLDDPGLADGRYGYGDLSVYQPAFAAEHSAYPVQEQATVHQYAADYISLEGRADATVQFTGSLVVPLVGSQVYDGEYQWWSNRGDEGDATLTRAFDLTALRRATLQAWMWYHLEKDYDYAYVEVSTDAGDSWTLLSSEHTTASNPTGGSYGPGFTGTSGGGESATWTHETFDLTPYAGRRVLIRFEVVTDDTIHYPGLCLDDISIPELGFVDDAETDGGGWDAEGWLRITSLVPQPFVVQLITLGQEPRIERIALDEHMRGSIALSGLGRTGRRAVLVVSATAPVTTEWASYSYRIASTATTSAE